MIYYILPFRFFLKFFMKCNQNCLKNAGNPRDMRRFQVNHFFQLVTLVTVPFRAKWQLTPVSLLTWWYVLRHHLCRKSEKKTINLMLFKSRYFLSGQNCRREFVIKGKRNILNSNWQNIVIGLWKGLESGTKQPTTLRYSQATIYKYRLNNSCGTAERERERQCCHRVGGKCSTVTIKLINW